MAARAALSSLRRNNYPPRQDLKKVQKSYCIKDFQRLSGRKNYNVAIIALARKLICLIHNLLVNQEMYHEDDCENRERKRASCDHISSSSTEERLEDKVAAIVEAYHYPNAHDRADSLKDVPAASPVSKFVPRKLVGVGG